MSDAPLRSNPVRVNGGAAGLDDLARRSGWSDGVPVSAATAERVRDLIAATPWPPDHVVATLAPNNGTATVENLAVNAAMAAVEPAAMPYVIAAIAAITRPDHNLIGLTTTTSSVLSALVVNGPRRRELGFDCEAGCMGGAGGRGSATVGRAVQLALRNIGGMQVGVTSRSVFGQPARTAGLCFAEWEERSPWPTLAERRGFAADAEVVTAHATKGTHAFADGNTDDDRELVWLIAKSMATPLGNAFHGPPGRGETMLALNPHWAERFGATYGAIENLQEALLEHAWVPAETWPPGARALLESKNRIGAGGKVMLHERPDQFVVVVCGGLGNLHAVALPTWGESTAQSDQITRP